MTQCWHVWHLLALTGVLGLLALAGCGGGGPAGSGSLTLSTPVHDATKPTSIGGTVLSLSMVNGTGVMDYPYNAEVVLTNVATSTEIATTHTSVRGGYSFSNLTEGVYSVSVFAPSRANAQLTGTLPNITAQGNIPQLMNNVLIGSPNALVTFYGHIIQDGQPAPHAVVSLTVDAYTPQYLKDNLSTDTTELVLTFSADATGAYTILAPAGATAYIIGAHSATSMVTYTNSLNSPQPGASQLEDLTLTDAVTPMFSELSLYVVSSSLEQPTASASTQAMISRLAAASVLHTPPAQLAKLQTMAAARRKVTRAANYGMVENDLIWDIGPTGDLGVRGFDVYRALQPTAVYSLIGATADPYLQYFFDNDPALSDGADRDYTVCSYAANGKTSAPSVSILAHPLSPISVVTADSATIPQGSGHLSWQPVPGAQSYLVLLFRAAPTYNDLPFSYNQLQASETSVPISGLPAGDYWWSVSAFDSNNPQAANTIHSASYSMYRKVTLQ